MHLSITANIAVILSVIAFASGAAIASQQNIPYSDTQYDLQDDWEKVVCVFSIGPLDCQTAKADAETALRAAETRYPGYALHNDEADAFRHCFWSALMTLHIGVSQAKIVGDNHEKLNDNPTGEKNMDLYNNAVGLQVGLLASGSDAAEETCHQYAMAKILLISP